MMNKFETQNCGLCALFNAIFLNTRSTFFFFLKLYTMTAVPTHAGSFRSLETPLSDSM